MDDKPQVDAIGRRRRARAPFKSGVGEALVEVFRKNRVAVDGHIQFAERLPRGGAHTGKDRLLVELLYAFHRQLRDGPLRSLDDLDVDRNLPGLSLVVVGGRGGDLYVAESVLPIQIRDSLFVAAAIALAVAPLPELPGRGHQVYALTDGLCVEVAISADVYLDQLVAGAEVDDVVDLHLIADHALSLVFDLGLEVALGLKIVTQIPLALDEQVPIHGVLLEDGYVALELSARYLRAHRLDLDLRSGADLKRGLHGPGVLVEIHFLQRHPRHQAVLFQIELADVVETFLGSRLGHGLPTEPAFPAGGRGHFLRRHLQLPEPLRGRVTRPRPTLRGEIDLDLVGGRVVAELGLHLRLVVAVAAEKLLDAVQALLHLFLGVELAELEAARIHELTGTGRLLDLALDRDAPDEPGVLRNEPQNYSFGSQFGVHLNVGVGSGRIEAIDGGADVG